MPRALHLTLRCIAIALAVLVAFRQAYLGDMVYATLSATAALVLALLTLAELAARRPPAP